MVDDERAREGLDHLQSAAKELIAAFRAMLDVAEKLVDDPGSVEDVVGFFGSAARRRDRGKDDDEPRVERIKLS
ncbi:MAG: hypothetical protein ACRD0U_01905 [Acidimicrobiales bacterium]